MTKTKTSLAVDVWADIVCPWCYVGEARLEKAAAALASEAEVTITPHAFELDPNHSHPEKILDHLAKKYGRTPDAVAEMDSRVATLAAEEGLPYTADRLTANTFDAHRLVAAAAEFGVALDVLRALQKGHFSGELDLSDGEALIATVASVGLDEARAREVLASDEFADAVRADQAQAREFGVTGVPFTVVNMQYAIPGAGAQEHYEKVLRTALEG
ncbi:DsbA family oxidoreductase [Demequina sp.]|uniref:DsbA family oxidoreductase n=1 Tax=Demequina sp. TaxID=2050685 RepID=UPI003D112D67